MIFKKRAVQMLTFFLIVVAALTIVSRVADAAAMARVKTQKVISGSIDSIIEINGMIEAKGTLSVFAEEGLRVKEIEVEEGMLVEKGDVLFRIDIKDVEENLRLINKEKKKLQLQIEDMNQSISELEKQREIEISRAQEDYTDTERKSMDMLNDAEEQREHAKEELQEHLSNPYKSSETEEERSKLEWEEKKKLLEEVVVEKEKLYQEAVKEREEAKKIATRQISDASKPVERDHSTVYLEMEIEEIDRKIQKLEKIIKEEGKVKAKKDGTIAKVNLEVGEKTTEGPSLLITDASKGYQFVGTMTEEELEKIQVGDMVTVIPSYQVEENSMEDSLQDGLSNRKVDGIQPADELGNYQIMVQIDAELVDRGGNAMISAEKSSQVYGSIVPLTALHNQDGETVVYMVKEKSTVLGVQKVLEKVEVNIVKQNQMQAAIEGNVALGDWLVIESNKPIRSGDRIRLIEE